MSAVVPVDQHKLLSRPSIARFLVTLETCMMCRGCPRLAVLQQLMALQCRPDLPSPV